MKNIFDKRMNRIDRLSEYRKISDLTTQGHIGTFEIEISSKAINKLKSIEKISFSLEHDFGIKVGTKEGYRLRINNECNDIKTDFNRLVKGYISPSQHFGQNNRGIQVIFNHIDIATTRGQLQNLVYILAEEIDKRYGDDCGWIECNNKSIQLIQNKTI